MNIRKNQEDPTLLPAALLGYQQQLEQINGKIADVRRRLGKRHTAMVGSGPMPPREPSKNRISPEGRAKTSARQKLRWAEAKGSRREISAAKRNYKAACKAFDRVVKARAKR